MLMFTMALAYIVVDVMVAIWGLPTCKNEAAKPIGGHYSYFRHEVSYLLFIYDRPGGFDSDSILCYVLQN